MFSIVGSFILAALLFPANPQSGLPISKLYR
jgi:hypothetical protein